MYSQAFPAHGRRGSRLGAGAPASARSSPRGSSAEPLGQCGARQSSPSTVGHKVRWMATPRRSHQRRRHPAAAAVRRPAGTCLNIRQSKQMYFCFVHCCAKSPWLRQRCNGPRKNQGFPRPWQFHTRIVFGLGKKFTFRCTGGLCRDFCRTNCNAETVVQSRLQLHSKQPCRPQSPEFPSRTS